LKLERSKEELEAIERAEKRMFLNNKMGDMMSNINGHTKRLDLIHQGLVDIAKGNDLAVMKEDIEYILYRFWGDDYGKEKEEEEKQTQGDEVILQIRKGKGI